MYGDMDLLLLIKKHCIIRSRSWNWDRFLDEGLANQLRTDIRDFWTAEATAIRRATSPTWDWPPFCEKLRGLIKVSGCWLEYYRIGCRTSGRKENFGEFTILQNK